jgi:hypothetical protein
VTKEREEKEQLDESYKITLSLAQLVLLLYKRVLEIEGELRELRKELRKRAQCDEQRKQF